MTASDMITATKNSLLTQFGKRSVPPEREPLDPSHRFRFLSVRSRSLSRARLVSTRG